MLPIDILVLPKAPAGYAAPVDPPVDPSAPATLRPTLHVVIDDHVRFPTGTRRRSVRRASFTG